MVEIRKVYAYAIGRGRVLSVKVWTGSDKWRLAADGADGNVSYE